MSASGRDDFAAQIPVSRETLAQLDRYEALLCDWSERLNLVAPSTLDQIWTRHFLDSAQLLRLIPAPEKSLLDMGTGAGFPGLVLAIMGVPQIHLAEHNMRKVAFLRTVIAALELPVTLHAMKVEAIRGLRVATVTARALTSLSDLIGMGRRLLQPEGVALFPKGRRAAEELTVAERRWRFEVEQLPSLTDPESTIFRLSDIAERTA